MSKIKDYNEKSSKDLGWDPSWFGCEDFGDKLTEAIKAFQKEMKVEADGMCGPGTFRRKFNERAGDIEAADKDSVYSDHIICHGKSVSIEWDKVILWTDKGGLAAKEGCYKPYYGGERQIDMFVNHWDVCLSSKICQKVLDQRGISVHFLIDNDGTIYQTLDTTHIAWHAGNENERSVGVEISNAYYTKYQDKYIKAGHGKRPVKTGAVVNGVTLEDHTDFYPVQIEALKALTKAIHKGLGIPLETPTNINGTEYTDTLPAPRLKAFKGFVHHYQLTSKKTDCGGLDLVKLLKEIK